jgi:hypothetical protein
VVTPKTKMAISFSLAPCQSPLTRTNPLQGNVRTKDIWSVWGQRPSRRKQITRGCAHKIEIGQQPPGQSVGRRLFLFGVLVCRAVTANSIGADMPKGTVKWFNSQKKGMGSFSCKAGAETCSSTSPRSNEPASAVSMRVKSSNMRKSRTRERHRQKISRFNADFARALASRSLRLRSGCRFQYFSTGHRPICTETERRRYRRDLRIGFRAVRPLGTSPRDRRHLYPLAVLPFCEGPD